MFTILSNKTNKRILAGICLLPVCISLSGCGKFSLQKQLDPNSATAKKQQQFFDTLTDEIFRKEVQSDSITLNYTLSNPEDYGITDFTPTFGEYGLEASKKQLAYAENVNAQLDQFDYNCLTEEQQLTYDVLKDYYAVSDHEEDYNYYGEALSSATGMQAQLPTLLSEYNIKDTDDIEDYLQLLSVVGEYFVQISDYEKEKSEAGLFMSDKNADNIISQCKDFIKQPKDNLLIKTFNEKVEHFDWLSKEEKTIYKKKNKKAILENVIPAYETLITTLTELKGTGTYEGGIGNLPKGKAFYEEMAQATTGSDMTIKEMKKRLETAQKDAIKVVASAETAYNKDHDTDIYEEYIEMKYPKEDPDEIVPYLEQESQEDFPALEDVNYTIKYVDESLEDYVSPAFYLTPPLDNFTENSIYINGSKENGAQNLFPTLAHEGYPGHLLQTVYYEQQKPAPIRTLLNYGGYSEGWATYCELYSFSMAGLDKNLADYAKAYEEFNLCMYATIDIGVNYDCWSKTDLVDYLSNYGITDTEVADSIYDIVVDDPGNYLQYVIGYFEMKDLYTKAEKSAGKQFDIKEFHTFLLDVGPAPFSIIEERMEDVF